MFSMLLLTLISIKVIIATLDPTELIVVKKKLHAPSLQEVAHVLNRELKKNFKEVGVSVVDCPDLRKPPFKLANAGLSGSPRVVEVGGAGHMGPYLNLSKVYDLTHLPSLLNLSSAFIIGASIGCQPFLDANSEIAVNIDLSDSNITQLSRACRISEDNKSYVQELLPKNETRYSFLANYFVSEGKPGKVLKVHLRERLSGHGFIQSMIKSLKDHFGACVALGGAFLLKEGHARHSLMPRDFPTTPFNTLNKMYDWFKFYNMSSPLTGVGVLTTSSYDKDLPDFHFHTFSNHGDCGHYYRDTTQDTTEYVGYFNIAEVAHRIDRPTVSRTLSEMLALAEPSGIPILSL